MENNVFRKRLVIGIIMMFVGASIIPNINGTIKDENDLAGTNIASTVFKQAETVKNLQAIDPLDITTFDKSLQSWLWAKSAGGITDDVGEGVAVDSSGNTYITGYFNGTATYGSIALISQGDYDIFVAKLNSDGVWQWAKSAGGTSEDVGFGVAVDTSGNAYITGGFYGTATFGSTTLISQGNADVFVAKLNSDGVWQWAKSAGGTSNDYGRGVAVDTSGNAYITGYFEGTATFGSTTLTSQGNADVFVAKLSDGGGNQDDLCITDVKPIQVVWDPSKFVVNKKTVVKVFITSTFDENKSVPIETVYNYGKNSWTESVLIKPGENWIYLPGGPSSNVNTPWGFGNEFLWTSPGTETQLKVIIDPNNIITETNENNNEFLCSTLQFIDTKDPYKIFYQSWKLPWFWDPGVSYYECYQTSFENNYFIGSSFPLKSNPWIGINPIPLTGGFIPSMGLGRDLLTLSLAGAVAGMNKVVGIVTGSYLSFHLQGDAIGVSLPLIDGAVIIKEGWWIVAAHEIQHTYDNWRRGSEEEYITNPPGNIANGFWVSEHDIIDSYNWWNYLGLCFMGGAGDTSHSFKYTSGNAWRDYWICNSCYEHLLTKLQTSKSNEKTSQNVIFISGYIDENDSVELKYIYKFDNRSISEISPGDYKIKMLDENGELIDEIPFNVSFMITIDPYGEIELNSTAFAFMVPYPELKVESLAKIQMLHNDIVLVERNISKHNPTVNVISPNGGETYIIGNNYTIQWEGNDLDGDKLNYCVLYSSNNSENWITLTVDLNQTEFIWNTTYLEPSTQYRIRVIANDGFNTAIDDSDGTFTLLNSPPDTPIINGPKKGNVGINYDYSFVLSDPNGDLLYYYIDWGDGLNTSWIGIYESGNKISIGHNWSERGTYIIKAKAKDMHSAESDWGTLTVIIPRSKNVNRPFLQYLQNFIQSHPNMFPLLRYLLGI